MAPAHRQSDFLLVAYACQILLEATDASSSITALTGPEQVHALPRRLQATVPMCRCGHFHMSLTGDLPAFRLHQSRQGLVQSKANCLHIAGGEQKALANWQNRKSIFES